MGDGGLDESVSRAHARGLLLRAHRRQQQKPVAFVTMARGGGHHGEAQALPGKAYDAAPWAMGARDNRNAKPPAQPRLVRSPARDGGNLLLLPIPFLARCRRRAPAGLQTR
jgi:hypothetical protein